MRSRLDFYVLKTTRLPSTHRTGEQFGQQHHGIKSQLSASFNIIWKSIWLPLHTVTNFEKREFWESFVYSSQEIRSHLESDEALILGIHHPSISSVHVVYFNRCRLSILAQQIRAICCSKWSRPVNKTPPPVHLVVSSHSNNSNRPYQCHRPVRRGACPSSHSVLRLYHFESRLLPRVSLCPYSAWDWGTQSRSNNSLPTWVLTQLFFPLYRMAPRDCRLDLQRHLDGCLLVISLLHQKWPYCHHKATVSH